jgi:hypothetical protein
MPQSFDAPNAQVPILRQRPGAPPQAPATRAPTAYRPPAANHYPSLADAPDGPGGGEAGEALPAGDGIQSLLSRWYHDPYLFAWEVFGLRLWSKQRLVCRLVAKTATGPVRIAVSSGHKTGKALALDTPIPTPTGWTTMGEVKVGDRVFDEEGRPCLVVAATEVMVGRPCYDIEFSDGTVITADAEHQWLTWTAQARRAHLRAKNPESGPEVVTTEQIRATLQSKNRGRNHAVKNAKPIQCPEAVLPLDPYILGVWLGDGHKDSPSVTSADPQIVEEMRRCGAEVGEGRIYRGSSKACLYSFLRFKGRSTRTILREIGVFCNKHVPAVYLRASAEQRLALLQGLMDTDGYADPRGRVEFCNTNRRIADAAFELAASLGFKPFFETKRAKLNGKDYGEKYLITFTPHRSVFRLKRKTDRLHNGKTKKTWVTQREIVAVSPRPSVPVRCIQVDSPSSLYLASRAFIPTHNSKMLAVIAIWFAITRPAGRVIITAPTARQIRDTLWREVTALYKAAMTGPCKEQPEGSLLFRAGLAGLGGKLNQMPDAGLRFPDGSEVVGFSTNSPERMAGTSGEHLLYLIDEASGVEQPIYDAIEGNRAGDASVVMFSNPTRTSGYFFEAFHGRNKLYWHRITISSEDTPNAVSGQKKIPGLATRAYIEEKRVEWGPEPENDPRYQVRILGRFPSSSVNQIVPMSLIEKGKAVWYTFAATHLGRPALATQPGRWKDIIHGLDELRSVRAEWKRTAVGPLTFGVDPAWEGDDSTAIYGRRGLRMFLPHMLKHTEGKVVSAAVVSMVRDCRLGADERPKVRIDAIGVGVASVERLREEPEVSLLEINSSKAAVDPNEYRNLRSEILFSARRFLELGGGFEPDPELERDLGAATYIINAAGQLEAESKRAIKKRIGRSPDRGDAFSLCTYDSLLTTQRVLSVQRYLPQTTDPDIALRDFGDRKRGF